MLALSSVTLLLGGEKESNWRHETHHRPRKINLDQEKFLLEIQWQTLDRLVVGDVHLLVTRDGVEQELHDHRRQTLRTWPSMYRLLFFGADLACCGSFVEATSSIGLCVVLDRNHCSARLVFFVSFFSFPSSFARTCWILKKTIVL